MVSGGVHGVDSSHESVGNARGEILDQDVMVSDSREGDVVFE